MSFGVENVVDFGKYVVWEVVEENEMVSGYSIISLEENFLYVLTMRFSSKRTAITLKKEDFERCVNGHFPEKYIRRFCNRNQLDFCKI